MNNMSAHTPGIWEAIGTAVHSTSGREIVFGAHMTRGADKVEQRANAKLIAAAPELLEALQVLLKRTAPGGPEKPRDMKSLISAYEQARAAIAKATGES